MTVHPSQREGPLRILLSCDSVGGVWTYVTDLARGLSEHRHAVTIAVLGPDPSPDQREDMAGIDDLELLSTGLPLDWTARDRQDVHRASSTLAQIATQSNADLVHLHSPSLAAGSAFPVPVVATCHSCVGTWWHAVKGSLPLPPDLAWRADLGSDGCQAADVLTAPTRAFADAVASFYGLSSRPVVVPNGRARTAHPLRAEQETSFVFAAGRLWDEAKNISFLDQVAASTSVPIVAAGAAQGPNGASVQLPSLHCMGSLSRQKMDDLLARRPIFASPALYEPFGLSVLEAAGFGCPLILSDIPTFREIWGDAALLLDPRDAAGWASAIDALATDPAAQAEWGNRAFARAAAFGLEPMISGTLAVYRSVLAGSGRRPVGKAA